VKRSLALLVAATALAAGCGNFFPNPDNVVLPSGVRAYDLDCGTLPRAECELTANKIVILSEDRPGKRVVKVKLEERGGYTVTFSDGNIESLIVD
jgi:hypothetical protein